MSLILEIDTRRDGDTATVLVAGELDVATHDRLLAELDSHLASTEITTLTLDLTELLFCDSAGLAIMLTTSRLAQVRGIDFEILSRAGSDVGQLFELSGIAARLPLKML